MNDLLNINYIRHFLSHHHLDPISKDIITACQQKLDKSHGDVAQWQAALARLPQIENAEFDVDEHAIRLTGNCDWDYDQLMVALKAFCPWRKGPFQFLNVNIDTEWDSLLKWQRVAKALTAADTDLRNKNVLDIGCGNGAFFWPMLQAEAKSITGVEPMWLFYHQFMVFQDTIRNPRLCFLPLAVQDLPLKNTFDTVLSMGVLYHRKSPLDHLAQLKGLLKKGGELVMETIVLPDAGKTLLTPPDRYAGMRNVWMISSVGVLHDWLEKMGFDIIHTSELVKTTLDEQRQSEWMNFHSLNQFLHPENDELTVEGHPAPYRVIIIARS